MSQPGRATTGQELGCTLVSSGVIILPVLNELEEFLGSPLLKKAHQGRFDCFQFGGGDLGDLSIPVDEATGDLFEFEVFGDLRVDQDACKFTRSDDKLWYQIDVIVPVPAKVGRHGLVWTKFTVELGEVDMLRSGGC